MNNEPIAPWRSPIVWPPKAWRLNGAQQTAADMAFAVLIGALLVTATSAIVALFVVPTQAIFAVFGAQHEAARNYLLALGALLGVPFLIWRTLIASHQAEISRESLYTQLVTSGVERLGAEKTIKIIEEKQVFKKEGANWIRDNSGNLIPEADHHGKPIYEAKTHERTELNLEVRLGAVYALERVALDSNRDKTSIMKTLAAYVRNNARAGSLNKSDDITRTDVKAALVVLGRFPTLLESEISYDLSKIDFKNTVLRDGSYQSCDFSDSISTGMYMRNVSLMHSAMHGAKWKNFQSRDCDLSNMEIYHATFDNSVFSDSKLINISSTEMNVDRGKFINSQIKSCNMINFDFQRSQFLGCSILEFNFQKGDLSEVRFLNTNIVNCHFYEVDLNFCNFENSPLNHVEFVRCNLTGIRSDIALHFDPNENFIAADGWIEEQLRQKVPPELIKLGIVQQWREWCREQSHT